MRYFKFRAYDGTMQYSEILGPEMFWCIYADKVIMQYTGYKDKYGKDIYEGDIIVAHAYPFFSDGDHNYSAEVLFEHGAWYYDLFQVSNRVRGSACGSGLDELIDSGRIEVIGNKYENPELLEIKEEK